MIVPVRGGTFLFRSGPGDFHLHICLTDPFDAPHEVPQRVLVVSACTVRGYRGEDLTCLLEPSDHDFIAVQSYIAYAHWRCLTVAQIQHAEGLKLAVERNPIASSVLQKLRDGLFSSKHVPKCAREFVISYEKAVTDARSETT
jgi:hypothetical protein